MFDEANVQGVELISVTVDYEPIDMLLGNEPRVDALVGISPDTNVPPDLAQTFDDRLTERLGRDVTVRIGFVEEQVSEERGDSTRSPLESLAVSGGSLPASSPDR